MSHVTSHVLRRLVDEPMAVPDRDRRHLAGCVRCQAESAEIAENAAAAARLLGGPVPVADLDLEWILLSERLRQAGPAGRPAVRNPWRGPWRLANVSVGAGTAAVVGVVAAGAAAAAALTTVYAPTHVAPLAVSRSRPERRREHHAHRQRPADRRPVALGLPAAGLRRPELDHGRAPAAGELDRPRAGRDRPGPARAGHPAAGRGRGRPGHGPAPGDRHGAVQPERRPGCRRQHPGDHRRPGDRGPVRRHVGQHGPDHAGHRRRPARRWRPRPGRAPASSRRSCSPGRPAVRPGRGTAAARQPQPRSCRCRSRPACGSSRHRSAGRRRCWSPTPTPSPRG